MSSKAIICSIILFILIIAGAFIYYSKNQLLEGDVYDKKHRLPWVQVVTIPLTISNGKSSTTILTPYVIYHPESWIISIKDFDEKTKEFRTNCFYVHKEIYDELKLGDRFKFDDSKGYDEEPIVKTKQ